MTSKNDNPDPFTVDAFDGLDLPAGVAVRLARAYPSANGLAAATPAEIAHAGGRRTRGGNTPAWAQRVAAAASLARLINTHEYRPTVNSPSKAHETLTRYVAHERAECFAVAMLDARQGLIEALIVHRGNLASVDVHPREVYRPAVAVGAHSILVAHNHPSGDAEPSRADMALTKRLVMAGELVGIPLLDHLVIAPGRCVSFGERGLLGGN